MSRAQRSPADLRTPAEVPTLESDQVPMLDVIGLADRLGVSERFVRRLVEANRVPYYKIGKFVRFHPDDIGTWLASKRVRQVHED